MLPARLRVRPVARTARRGCPLAPKVPPGEPLKVTDGTVWKRSRLLANPRESRESPLVADFSAPGTCVAVATV